MNTSQVEPQPPPVPHGAASEVAVHAKILFVDEESVTASLAPALRSRYTVAVTSTVATAKEYLRRWAHGMMPFLRKAPLEAKAASDVVRPMRPDFFFIAARSFQVNAVVVDPRLKRLERGRANRQ